MLVLVVLLTEVIAFEKKYMSEGEISFDNLSNLISINKVSDSEKNARNYSEYVSNAVNRYPDLQRSIKTGNIKVPSEDEMVPQGITTTGKYIIITAYDYKNKEDSKCYVLNKGGELINTVSLDTVSHVGGVAYDSKNQLLWIPDKDGVLNAYDSDTIMRDAKATAKYKFTDLGEGLNENKNKYSDIIDYLCLYDEYLYIGSFHLKNSGLVKKYRIVGHDNEVKLEYVRQFKVPSLVQGISFFEQNEKEYMILSRSFGRNNNSKIQIFEYNDVIEDYSLSYLDRITLVLPPMLEQNIVYNEELYMLFESNANKYRDSIIKVDSILVLDLDRVLE